MKRGFTLIELLVVIAVLGILAAGVFVAINPLKRINQANDARIKSDIGQIANAMQAYYVMHQSYPTKVADLVTSGDLKTEPTTPDGNKYTINPTDDNGNSCTTSTCTQATIIVPLAAPQTTGASWKWDSTTGQAVEYVAPTPTLAPTPTGVNANNPTGNFEGATCTNFNGWTCDLDLETKSIGVSFYDETNNLIGSTIANIYRPDSTMARICANSYYHQFSYNVTILGQHTIRAMVDNIDSYGNVVGQSQIPAGSPRQTNPTTCP